jgi:uncharacterized C2H2 Zn-finger protein
MKQIAVPLFLLSAPELYALSRGRTVNVTSNGHGTFMLGLEAKRETARQIMRSMDDGLGDGYTGDGAHTDYKVRLKKNGEPRAAWGSLHRKKDTTRAQPKRLHCSKCTGVFPTRKMMFKHMKVKHGYVGGNQHTKKVKHGNNTTS